MSSKAEKLIEAKPQRDTAQKTIGLPGWIVEKAREFAESHGQSMSYVVTCILEDSFQDKEHPND